MAEECRMRIAPCSLSEARRFVSREHRHNTAPQGWKFGCALLDGDGFTIGVGIAGRPVGRGFDDGVTLELTRITVKEGHPNGCSMLYGALCRAATALGYERAVTYTRADEPGTSPAAAGFTRDAELPARGGWDNRPLNTLSLLDDNPQQTEVAKVRWVRRLASLETET
jgi:hypothetical protein